MFCFEEKKIRTFGQESCDLIPHSYKKSLHFTLLSFLFLSHTHYISTQSSASFYHGHTLRLSRLRWHPFRRLFLLRRSPHLRQAPTVHRPQTQTNRRTIRGSLRSQSRLTRRACCVRGSGCRRRWLVFLLFSFVSAYIFWF